MIEMDIKISKISEVQRAIVRKLKESIDQKIISGPKIVNRKLFFKNCN